MAKSKTEVPAAPSAEPATQPEPQLAPPHVFSPLRIARHEGLGGHDGPWFSVFVSPAVEDKPAFAAAIQSVGENVFHAAEKVRDSFLAGNEFAQVAAADARVAEHEKAVSDTEAELADATAEWKQAFGFGVARAGTNSNPVKELEEKVRGLKDRLESLKGELPSVLTDAVRESKAEVKQRFAAAIKAELDARQAALEARVQEARDRLAAAMAGPFAEWMAAVAELKGVGYATRRIPELTRIDWAALATGKSDQ